MKICLINNLYYPDERGGAEKVVAMIVAGLQRAGHEPFVICTGDRQQKSFGRGPNGEEIFYVRAFNLGAYGNLSGLPWFARLVWHIFDRINIFVLRAVKKIIAQKKPDAVITHNLVGLSFLLPAWLAKKNIPHAHCLHDIQLLHPSGLLMYGREKMISTWPARIYQALARRLFSAVPLLISPSRWLLQTHQERRFFSSRPGLILPNPLAGEPNPVRKKSGADSEFLYVGQITAAKGVFFLLAVFADYLARGGRGRLVIAGGPECELKWWSEKLGDRLFCLGRINSRAVLAAMSAADALIVPSLCYENSPTVIHEAMLAGLPVIAANLGGIPELLQDRGRLFTPGDPSALLRQLFWANAHRARLEETGRQICFLAGAHRLDDYIRRLLRALENIR